MTASTARTAVDLNNHKEEKKKKKSDEEEDPMRELLEVYLREHAPSRLADLNTLTQHPRLNNAHDTEKVYARLNKMYARERAATARQRRRMTAFYQQYAPSEAGKIQPLLERGLSEEVVFNALYKKYGVPAEEQMYSSEAQEQRRREITAFFKHYYYHHQQQQEASQEEKEKNAEAEMAAIEEAMNMDGPLDVVLRQLREKYKYTGEETSPPAAHNATVEEKEQSQRSQQKQKGRNKSDERSALRQRLTAFYAIHCPSKVEEKVTYAMSLNVDEDVLFSSLHRRYHLDADGNPLSNTDSSTATTTRTGTTTEREQLRQRLIAFYEKHNPVNVEAKVQRALSLNVDEEELFRALYRQYHLDESGEPIVKSTDTHVPSNEDEDKITIKDTPQMEEQTTVENPTGKEDSIIENNNVRTKDEITSENDKKLTDSVTTLNHHDLLQKFFQEFYEEKKEMLQQQWMNTGMGDEELMKFLYKLKENGEIMPSIEPKALPQHLPPPLFAFDEQLERLTTFEMVPAVPSAVEVQKPITTTTTTTKESATAMMSSTYPSDVCENSFLTLFSRHTRWFAGNGWKHIKCDELRNTLLSDLAEFTGWSYAKDMDAVIVEQQQDQQEGVHVTFFIPCRDRTSAETNEKMVKTAVFPSVQQLLLDQMLTQQQDGDGEETLCVNVRCLFPRMRGSVLRRAPDAQRALFVRALEVDLLAHAAQSGASHLTLGSRMSVRGGKGLELRCEMYFPSDAQAGAYVMLLLSDNAVYCREARRTYALLGGDAHEVAVAVVTPIPASIAVNNNNTDGVIDGDAWSAADREAALECRESQLLAREKELQSRLMLLEQREKVVRRLSTRDAVSGVGVPTIINSSTEDRALRLASEVRARLAGH
ncbi:uncharacterized protein TM35_000302390 [Trypanosoma theileri]|uniref:Uncharacterized protein n=1 Tax=Trypanosoma theileri TaxID=67003 RepID=A0A1X0NPU1_9TRYP|nr:uncharacterized protein TM35_000302390 [Trypanosoma theileri]ORC86199.1 hypothetical protein TM35_000302390 [Trypanosoma theileri]